MRPLGTWGTPVGERTERPLRLPLGLLGEVHEKVAMAAGERAAEMTHRLLVNTVTTTLDLGDGDGAYVITGDIPAMWLRDSCLQLAPLLRLLPTWPELAEVPASLLRRQWRMIQIDPYANAFNQAPNGNQFDDGDEPRPGPWVWERKWELDSLTFPLDLALRLAGLDWWTWETPEFRPAVMAILQVAEAELRHDESSPYRFARPGAGPADTLARGGLGPETTPCGLVFQAFRPSDDACQLGFNVPGNLFFASTLHALTPLLDLDLRGRADSLAIGIRDAVAKHAIVPGPMPHFAYEVDGAGNSVFLDDANLPSLLSLPYLDVLASDDPLYLATRRKVLSGANPYFVEGSALTGVGSPHTPEGYVWPIAVATAGLTATSREAQLAALKTLTETTGHTGWMHEGVDANDPTRFTRPWFSWANAMFCELALEVAGFQRPRPLLRQE